MKAPLFWAKSYWNARSWKPVILEQHDNNLRMKTETETVFDVPLSSVHAKFTRWGRMLLTIDGTTYIVLGSGGYTSHSKAQLAELQATSVASTKGGSAVGIGQGINSAAGAIGSTAGQVAGTGLQVAGAVDAAAGQFAAQEAIEAWHKMFEEKGVGSMDYKPANAYMWFLIFLGIAFVVGLFIAIKFFKH